jgi:Zn-dependent protease with chaperone function
MQAWIKPLFVLALWALALPAPAEPLLDLPRYPQIDRAALERHAARTLATRLNQARDAGELGCLRYCEMIAHAFARISAAAREQGEPEGGAVQWRLVVTTTRGEAALSLPGGAIIVSEDMIASLGLSEAELGFILAHEVAHVLMQHEAEALEFLQATLMPRGLSRSVWDLYAELDYNTGALLRLESLMQRGELEADYAGLLIGAQAGYAPAGMLSALAKIAGGEQARSGIVNTHPLMAARLARVRTFLPVAERLVELRAAGR